MTVRSSGSRPASTARMPLLVPYLVAGTLSCLAALCFVGPTLPALRQAALEGFGAGAGLLLLANRNRRLDPDKPPAAEIVPLRWGWIVAAVLITLVFSPPWAAASGLAAGSDRTTPKRTCEE